MDLIFHIGCEKTGTTSLQFWLDQNAPALLSRGVFYSAALGRPNNRRISYYGQNPGAADEGLVREGVRSAAQHAALQEQIAVQFAAEVKEAAQAGAHTFVISNEHCHSRLKTPETVARVHELLAPHFARIRIVCFLRPQVDLCLSLASTMTRNGHAINRDWVEAQLRRADSYYDFEALLRRWADVFGKPAVEPVPFKRYPEIIGYFEQLLGIGDLNLPRRRTQNTAVDFRVMQIVNAMHAADPGQRDMDFGSRFFVNELPVEQRLTLDLQSARLLQARFDRSNHEVCVAWPQIQMSDLTPNWQHYPARGNIDDLNAALQLGPMLRRIIDRMRTEALYHKARVAAVTSEREMLRGRPDSARDACREGIAFAEQAMHVEVYRKPLEHIVAGLEQRMRRIDGEES